MFSITEGLGENPKLRNILVTVHLDSMHMCMQVIEVVFWFLCTYAYHPNKWLPGCSSVFHFFTVFPWTWLFYYYYIYIYIYTHIDVYWILIESLQMHINLQAENESVWPENVVFFLVSYVAPEYACTGMLTEKSDVYSFGILIMEIITGRNPVDYARPRGEVSISF